ncbi:S-adenosyl-L-methionine-dependent methyltransferase [Lindgomyces ingoldianus]|uniref:S-adenosyl-L-methionine-dependent methyltransferase n=1 Tax=Lindgomyces ingoldianus TaxID=673940 RepID=A0ACB6RFT3_9PLEO|nr:S-adenosyl-L-methionine-dependent methyltransferase [Lindgomyces ingoldianus]KAF2477977.1 S-adenosyl-L-methionine-dependent methyltransferase [Lindgomyces ingoldianus]
MQVLESITPANPPSAIQMDRTYHTTEAAYSLPNEVQPNSNVEHQRLEMQHSLFIGLMEGRIMHAPISNQISKAIDIGCGTGSVTHTIASAYPSTTVYGVDLSPIPEYTRSRLPNLSYVQADFDELVSQDPPDPRFKPASFDYVFSRLLIYGISDWPTYLSRAISLAKPGAWIEMQEADYHWYRIPMFPSSPSPAAETFASHNLTLSELTAEIHPSERLKSETLWSQTMNALLLAKHLNPHAGSSLASLMSAAGLVDINIRRYISPAGVWPGLTPEASAFGKYVGKQTPLMYVPAIRKLGRETGWDEGEVEAAVRNLEAEFEGREDGQRLWFWVYVVCGRKPNEDGKESGS